MLGFHPLPQEVAARGAAIEEKVERHEPGNERRIAALGVRRMTEFLPLDADTVGLEGVVVEVMARAAEAAEEGAARPDLLAQVQQQLGARPLGAHFGAALERRADLERLTKEIEHREVHVDELVPARLEDLLEPFRVKVEERGLAIRVLERLEVRRAPRAAAGLAVVHELLDDALLL